MGPSAFPDKSLVRRQKEHDDRHCYIRHDHRRGGSAFDSQPAYRHVRLAPDFYYHRWRGIIFSPPADIGFSLKEAVQTIQFWLGFFILFCFGYGVIAIAVHLFPHITGLGISDISAANVMAINGGVGIIGNIFVGGFIGDRIGNRKVILIGFILAVVSLVWLLPSRELWMFYLFAIVLGIAMGSIGTSESPLVARLFGLKNHGLIYGIFVLGFTAGGAVGPLVTGYIYDTTGSYYNAFLACIAFAVVGFILTVLLKPTREVGMEL